MQSSAFFVGLMMAQVAVLLGLAWGLSRWWHWRAWWTRPILLLIVWFAGSVALFLLFWASGADVYLIPYMLAAVLMRAAVIALPVWLLAERLVRKID